MENPAVTDHPIHELLAQRFSPRAFGPEPVSLDDLHALLEAARWAASCANEQPWVYIVARREDEAAFARLLSCLVDKNQTWARHAAVLMFSVALTTFKSGKPNHHAWHDVGQASAQLTAEATARGLRVHQMAGFDAARTREQLAIPEGHDPVAAIALGHPGDPEALPEDLRDREIAPRHRKPFSEVAFGGTWDAPLERAEK
ncbi:nitroreductase family protein [Chondromyces apiculatus]|uniref:Nitroreductase n=1 Tax=Chondromyces apiculatus DSM 436 TaxID=1192034 RepID=A0A017SXZ6_9BACT|nr:nitroreductase family protein [Chondromyces apiculatus]EYF01864.1 nitroreductase [Chondromyces apiculatus DSM 436]